MENGMVDEMMNFTGPMLGRLNKTKYDTEDAWS